MAQFDIAHVVCRKAVEAIAAVVFASECGLGFSGVIQPQDILSAVSGNVYVVAAETRTAGAVPADPLDRELRFCRHLRQGDNAAGRSDPVDTNRKHLDSLFVSGGILGVIPDCVLPFVGQRERVGIVVPFDTAVERVMRRVQARAAGLILGAQFNDGVRAIPARTIVGAGYDRRGDGGGEIDR